MEKWTSSISGMTEHLEPEVLASFLDGKLPEDENRRVRRHLAECEDCHQVFVVTVDFLREEEQREAVEQGNVRPFARPGSKEDRGSWRWRVAVAATVVLAVGTGGLGYQVLEGPGTSGKGLQGLQESSLPTLDFLRSASSQPIDDKSTLILGALQATREASASQGANLPTLVDRISSILKRDPALRKLDPNDPDFEADLRRALDAPQWFELGEWAAVGKAAAQDKRADLLRGSWRGFRFGRVLSRLQREKSGALDPAIHTRLGKIEDLLDARTLNFSALETVFDEILASR